jgi:hypothetical protein
MGDYLKIVEEWIAVSYGAGKSALFSGPVLGVQKWYGREPSMIKIRWKVSMTALSYRPSVGWDGRDFNKDLNLHPPCLPGIQRVFVQPAM